MSAYKRVVSRDSFHGHAPRRVFRYGQQVSAVERVFTRNNPLVSKSGRLFRVHNHAKSLIVVALVMRARVASGSTIVVWVILGYPRRVSKNPGAVQLPHL